MKRAFSTILSIAAAILALSSCETKPKNMLYQSFMTCVHGEKSEEYPFFFVSDDSVRIYPINFKEFSGTPEAGTRVLGHISVPIETELKDPLHATFISMSEVLTPGISQTSKPDTLGSDFITIKSIWQSGGVYGAKPYINMQFLYYRSQFPKVHYIRFSKDTTEALNPDHDGYYRLMIHHNAKDDFNHYVDYGYVSLELEGEIAQEGIKGVRIRQNPIANDAEKVVTYDYVK